MDFEPQKSILKKGHKMDENVQNFTKDYFFIRADYKIYKINFEDILYVESLGEYIRFYTTDVKIVTLFSLSKLENLLPRNSFFRIHRSYIVNVDKINFIQNNIVSIGQHQINISKGQKKDFMELINRIGFIK